MTDDITAQELSNTAYCILHVHPCKKHLYSVSLREMLSLVSNLVTCVICSSIVELSSIEEKKKQMAPTVSRGVGDRCRNRDERRDRRRLMILTE